MEIVIDGIEYDLVPKETKSELELLKEKYESGSYICIGNRVGSIDKISELDWPKWHADWQYVLIHKKHRSILDAWLADNSVEIECKSDNETYWIDNNFIKDYRENLEYRLKQQYPIFKRNEDGEVFKITSSGSSGTEYETMLCEDFDGRCILSGKTIPYDKEKGLYHLQPVWYWSYQFAEGNIIRTIAFFDVINNAYIIGSRTVPYEHSPYEGFHIITLEQLKVMPFVWEMYQQVLKG